MCAEAFSNEHVGGILRQHGAILGQREPSWGDAWPSASILSISETILRANWVNKGSILAQHGFMLANFRAFRRPSWAILGPSWPHLWPSESNMRASRRKHKTIYAIFEQSRSHLRAKLDQHGAILGQHGPFSHNMEPAYDIFSAIQTPSWGHARCM